MSIITFSEDENTLVVDCEVYEAVEDKPNTIEICGGCDFKHTGGKIGCYLEGVLKTQPRCLKRQRSDDRTIHWVKNPGRMLLPKRKSKQPEQSQEEIDIISQLL